MCQLMKQYDVICIGAGPAGLTAAYQLSKNQHSCLVLEKDPDYVGGISRTVNHNGYRFDIGGHRFFSKSEQIEALWREILGDDLIVRSRSSRIYYHKKFFSYPFKPFEALFKLGFLSSIAAVVSYVKVRLFPIKKVTSFEDWVCNQFGVKLYRAFFKTYTEKVWGMPCSEISADWAAQRIKGLSLSSAIKQALLPRKANKSEVIKTLIDSFHYPRLGPGMMWEKASSLIVEMNNEVTLGADVVALAYDKKQQMWSIDYRNSQDITTVQSKSVISSMPMRELIGKLKLVVPEPVKNAADSLHYRDFIIVALMIDTLGNFDDNWIYIHDESVKVGRVQNFRSWSEELIPEQGKNCYGMEYFCFENDGLWDSSDDDLIALACKEICQIGLVKKENITGGYVIRQAKAYPVYDADYQQNVATISQYLEKECPDLHLVGRNGMHKYNNQDHAMMTAMLTVENIIQGKQIYDVWQVNQDAEYHEQGSNTSDKITGRSVPKRRRP